MIVGMELLEVTLQQALKCYAVSCLVTSHLVNGVVDSVQAVLLSAGSQVELALGCAELAVNAPGSTSKGKRWNSSINCDTLHQQPR